MKKMTACHFYYFSLSICFLFFIHFLWVGGITMDGGTGIWMVEMHRDIALGKIPLPPIKTDIPYYGVVNVLPGYCLAKLIKAIFKDMNFHDTFQFSIHITSFLFSVATSLIVVQLCKLLKITESIAWAVGAMLMLYPVWLGHSFMNFKDIPTAFFYTCLTYAACHLARTSDCEVKLKFFFLVSAVGLLGIKLAFLPAVVATMGLLMLLKLKNGKGLSLQSAFFMGILVIIGAYLVTPASWREPLAYLKNEIILMSKHGWKSGTLTWGECISPHSHDWNALTYLLKWYSSQLPLLYIVSFGVGIWVLLKKGMLQNPAVLFLLAQLFFLPFLGVCKNSVFYNGTRHVLFMLPPFMVILGLGFDYLYAIFLRKNLKTFASISFFAYSSFLMGDLWAMAPYQYIYYNEVARFFLNDETMLSDYWAVSISELFHNIPRPYKASYMAGKPFCLQSRYLDQAGLKAIYSEPKIKEPFYYIINIRKKPKTMPDFIESCCRVESSVTRRLLFSPHVLTLSKAFWCKLPPVGKGLSNSD